MRYLVLILSFLTLIVFYHHSKNENQITIEEVASHNNVETEKPKKSAELSERKKTEIPKPALAVQGLKSPSVLTMAKTINNIDKTLKELNFPHCLENRLLNPKEESRVIALAKRREILKTKLFNLRYQKIQEQFK